MKSETISERATSQVNHQGINHVNSSHNARNHGKPVIVTVSPVTHQNWVLIQHQLSNQAGNVETKVPGFSLYGEQLSAFTADIADSLPSEAKLNLAINLLKSYKAEMARPRITAVK